MSQEGAYSGPPETHSLDVVGELSEFTRLPLEEVRRRMDEHIHRTARLFTEHEGTPESFYATTDAYLFELANWEGCSFRAQLAETLGRGLGGKHLHVLEYGFGIGSFALKLAEQAFQVTACDVNEPAIAFFRFRVAKRQWEDRVDIVYPEEALGRINAYSVISSQHVLEHVPDPLDTLRRFCQCLRPGGLFLGIAPFDLVGPEFPEHDPKNAHLRLATLCEEAGLRVEGVHPFQQMGNSTFELVQAVKEK